MYTQFQTRSDSNQAVEVQKIKISAGKTIFAVCKQMAHILWMHIITKMIKNA